MWSHGVADAEGMCHFPLMGGSPCFRGRRWRRGLPHCKSAAAHRNTLAEGYVGKIIGYVLEAPWLVSDSHILQEGIYSEKNLPNLIPGQAKKLQREFNALPLPMV